MLSGEIVRRGIEADIKATFRGSAGQSFGAWLHARRRADRLRRRQRLRGQGALRRRIAVRPDPDARAGADDDVIAGNTTLYGATAGRAFFRGLAGERFAVRNSRCRRGRRGRRRSLLRVHDRRPRGRARARRGATSRRA